MQEGSKTQALSRAARGLLVFAQGPLAQPVSMPWGWPLPLWALANAQACGLG